MTGPFRFRLDVVDQLRRREQQQEQRLMADAVKAVLDARRLIALIEQRVTESRDQQRRARSDVRPDISALRHGQLYELWLQRRMNDAQGTLSQRRESMDAQREKLVAASRRVKVIEKLRERQWTRYQQDQRRAENRESDEIGILAFVRAS